MKNFKVVISDCDHGHINPELEIAKANGTTIDFVQSMNTEEIIARAKSADALLCQRFQVTAEVMEALPNLKVIGRYGSGVDNVDLAAAKKRGIRVVYTPYFCFTDVANHTVAGLLYLSRGFYSLDSIMKSNANLMREKYAERTDFVPFVRRPSELKVGIVGFGKIGRAVAIRLRAFGFQLEAYDPFVPSQVMSDLGVKKISALSEIARNADFLTVHTPLTSDTKNLIDEKIIGIMKPSAYILNNARGGIVHEASLIQALRDKKLAGAALDVLEEEPIRANLPLREFPNVLLSPHMAFYSRESLQDLKERIMRYIVSALQQRGEWEEV